MLCCRGHPLEAPPGTPCSRVLSKSLTAQLCYAFCSSKWEFHWQLYRPDISPDSLAPCKAAAELYKTRETVCEVVGAARLVLVVAKVVSVKKCRHLPDLP